MSAKQIVLCCNQCEDWMVRTEMYALVAADKAGGEIYNHLKLYPEHIISVARVGDMS